MKTKDRILQLMKDLDREVCYHDIEGFLNIKPEDCCFAIKSLILEKSIVKLFEKSNCKESHRKHTFYRYNRSGQIEPLKEEVKPTVLKPKLCACGCGFEALEGNLYKHGHNMRGKHVIRSKRIKYERKYKIKLEEKKEIDYLKLKVQILKELMKEFFYENKKL